MLFDFVKNRKFYKGPVVIKSGGVDVGTQMIILAINRCLDAVALQNVGLWYHHTTLEER